eukprot:scaffold303781_cov96-Cyclotella_meneghiniana.AAC.3
MGVVGSVGLGMVDRRLGGQLDDQSSRRRYSCCDDDDFSFDSLASWSWWLGLEWWTLTLTDEGFRHGGRMVDGS